MANTLITHVENALQLLQDKPEPHFKPILKNLQDALYVYQNALTNLDTVLEDSINKLRDPSLIPKDPPRKWWQ